MKQQKLLIRIAEIFFLVLMGVSVLLTVIFYLNTNKINTDDPLAMQISQIGPILNYLTYWAYVLCLLAVIFAVGFPIFQMASNPKKGLRALISVGLLGVLMFVTYQLGDDTLMNIPGYNGPDNIPTRLKLSDMVIFSMYGMVVISLVALLYAEISKLFK